MTPDEASALAATLHASGNGLALRAVVHGDHIVFTGGSKGEHSLAISVSSPARVLAHWSGYVTSNGLPMPAVAKVAPTAAKVKPKTAKQLDAEIAVALAKPRVKSALLAPALSSRPARTRPLAVVTYWGKGQRALVEYVPGGGRRYARVWNVRGQRWNRSYEIDTHDKGTIWQGDATHPPNKEPSSGVRDIRPATLTDLKRFKFKLKSGDTIE